MSLAVPHKYTADPRTSAYDRLSAALSALTMIFGTFAVLLFMMWLSMLAATRPRPPEVAAIPPMGDPGEEKPLGVADDILEPGIEDLYEVDVPQLADAVEAVTDAPSRFRGLLATVDGDAAEMGKGRGLGSRDGGGGGGGGRGYERWAIEYESENVKVYLQQLAGFGIQIGAVNKVRDEILLLLDLDSQPQSRPVKRSEEKRIYFVHAQSKLKFWDMRFAKKAGVDTTGKIMVQFYPPETTQVLAQLELDEANRRGLKVEQIRRTVFKVRPVGGGFEYYVADVLQK